MPVTIRDVRAFKERGERFAMLTAYDYPTARILDEAGIPVLLVGDSVADNMLGYPTTVPVTMEEMLHHTRAVARGASNALVVGDLPFMSYQESLEEGIHNAGRMLKEGGAHAVKFEGAMTELAHALGGYRVQGKSDQDAQRLAVEAESLAKAGAFAIVLEGIPADVARRITESVEVPTIGIGAGPHCDGQVLVITDLLGLSFRRPAKFVKPYANLREEITRAVTAFRDEVAAGAFPDEAHSYH